MPLLDSLQQAFSLISKRPGKTTMLTTISYGEALVDMLSNRIGEHKDGPETFTKFAGGAPANVAVAIARLGGQSRLAGKLGEDMFGEFLRSELNNAGVNTDCLLSTNEANTALAFVSLDNQGERSFSFYRNPSADMLFKSEEFAPEWFVQPGIFHFCSNTLTTANTAAVTQSGVEAAHNQGWLISFDVNLRHNLWSSGSANNDVIKPLIAQSDLLKMSKEELEYLCENASEAEFLHQVLSDKTQLVLITDGGNPLRIITQNTQGTLHEQTLTPPPATMVDSTGAGDAFIGGFLYQLATHLDNPKELSHFCQNTEQLLQSLMFAARCGGHTASHYGAFSAMPTLQDIEE